MFGLSACGAPTPTVANIDPVDAGAAYQSQYRAEGDGHGVSQDSISMNAMACKDNEAAITRDSHVAHVAPVVERLSVGDLVEVMVGADDLLTHSYKIDQDGAIRLPHIPPIHAQGRRVEEVEAAIGDALVAKQLYNAPPSVSVRIVDSGPARVFVSGAVFEPGAEVVGGVSANSIDTERERARGWDADGRRLSRALQSAGGVRPDADLAHVELRRGGSKLVIDARPAISGRPFSDLILLDGDEIDVPSRGCFQEALMVPSAVTAQGIKVFMSTLTQPAVSNSTAAVSKDATELRYGTRFFQAAVGMNCVGGTLATNSDRSIVLYTRNPITGRSIVIVRRVEDMISRPDRDDYDPYLLSGDALACYDSTVVNLEQIATGVLGVSTAITSIPSKLGH